MSVSAAPKVSDLDDLKRMFKEADKDHNGVLNRSGW